MHLAPVLLPGGDGDGQRLVSSDAICQLCTFGRELGDASLPSWAQAWLEAEPGATVAPAQSCILFGDVWINTVLDVAASSLSCCCASAGFLGQDRPAQSQR